LLTGQTVVADIASNDPGREAKDCFIHSVFPQHLLLDCIASAGNRDTPKAGIAARAKLRRRRGAAIGLAPLDGTLTFGERAASVLHLSAGLYAAVRRRTAPALPTRPPDQAPVQQR
jgi:hypothetical protein